MVGQGNANDLKISDRSLLVRSTADIADLLVGDEYVLPASALVELSGPIDLGARALRPSEGTVIVGNAHGMITSTADGVVRASGLESPVIMREFNIVATAGRCLDLSGPITQQLNLFFIGLIGAAPGTSVGTITGFDVQALKDCYINAPAGIRLDGTTNKIFFSQCPFYGITGSAITLASTLDAEVADIVTSFFKFDSPGVAIEAEAGYQVAEGILRGSLRKGTAIPLVGLSAADVNWSMHDNSGIRDSRVAAQAYLTTSATMTIAEQGVYYPVAGEFTLSEVAERFRLTENNELEYIGLRPELIEFGSSFAVDPANNNLLGFRASKNGVGLVETTTMVQQGAGPGASPRSGAVIGLIEVVTGDTIGLEVANMESTASIDWVTATYAVKD